MRLHAHDAGRVQLEDWFARFSGLCVAVDAAKSASEVASASYAIASGVLTAKAAGQAAEACSCRMRAHSASSW